jgi:hypothetical protein
LRAASIAQAPNEARGKSWNKQDTASTTTKKVRIRYLDCLFNKIPNLLIISVQLHARRLSIRCMAPLGQIQWLFIPIIYLCMT